MLNHRPSHASRRAGRAEAALPELLQAESLIAFDDEPYLALSTSTSLANFYTEVGELGSARRQLANAKRLCEQVDHSVAACQIEWIAGRVDLREGDFSDALTRFEWARQRLIELGEADFAAVTSLDLALVNFELQRREQAVALAVEVIPIFEAFKIHREALVALQILRKVTETAEITRTMLNQLRVLLRSMPVQGCLQPE